MVALITVIVILFINNSKLIYLLLVIINNSVMEKDLVLIRRVWLQQLWTFLCDLGQVASPL